ncbi:hypothetical protein [Scandinavium goeteborgense]|nr:hypothetical protein [Scandinavium goeteborgense]
MSCISFTDVKDDELLHAVSINIPVRATILDIFTTSSFLHLM